MHLVSVTEAAKSLGVSGERVRQLIHDGALDAHQVGGRWLVDQRSVARRAAADPRAGRPFSPAAAWALLALASNRDAGWVPEAEVRRLREILVHRGIEAVHHQLRNRAEVHGWYVHPALLDDLLGEAGVVVGGPSASGTLRSSGPVEVYLSPAAVNRLVARYRPDQESSDPNLIVRLVRGPWPFAPDERRAWPALAAADLLDHPDDVRARQAARELLAGSRA
jgi:excisionase family DNA binding protein